MFDDFMDSQKIAYSLLTNSIKNGKLSHAYLIDGNNNENSFDFVLSLAKMILCDKHYSNFDNCGKCNRCDRIDSGNYTELRIIETDSMVIKKEQLLDLKSEFSKSGIEGNKRVYIINNCDKMNKQFSNSLLKFLEEPDEGIVAILFTNHINNVLSTVKSRCQIIKLSNYISINSNNVMLNFAHLFCSNQEQIDSFINDELYVNMVSAIVKFVSYYEENKLDVMIYLKEMWYSFFKTRQDYVYGVSLIVNFYYDLLKCKYNIDNYFFSGFEDLIEKLSDYNATSTIVDKINICIKKIEDLKYNLNLSLVLDDMIIKMDEVMN